MIKTQWENNNPTTAAHNSINIKAYVIYRNYSVWDINTRCVSISLIAQAIIMWDSLLVSLMFLQSLCCFALSWFPGVNDSNEVDIWVFWSGFSFLMAQTSYGTDSWCSDLSIINHKNVKYPSILSYKKIWKHHFIDVSGIILTPEQNFETEFWIKIWVVFILFYLTLTSYSLIGIFILLAKHKYYAQWQIFLALLLKFFNLYMLLSGFTLWSDFEISICSLLGSWKSMCDNLNKCID